MTDRAAAAFEDLPTPVWELSGPDLLVAAANRAARELFDDPAAVGPFADLVPGLPSVALAQLASVRDGDVPLHRATWSVDVPGPRGRLLLAVELVAVRRPAPAGGAGVLVHARDAGAVPSLVARETLQLLQRTLLPSTLPVLPDVEMAARYRPAALDSRAGGDWFDAVVTADGRIAVSTGDLVGHGPGVAIAMGGLLAVVRASLAGGDGLDTTLARADRHAAASDSCGASMAVALVDPASGELQHARCGHPPPLVRSAAGRLRPLAGDGGGPLGVGAVPPPVHRDRLDRDETLLLHTDGLTRRAGHDSGTAALVTAALTGHGAGPLCDTALACLDGSAADGAGADDDVALIAVHRRPEPVRPLVLDIPAEAGELAAVRRRVGTWLAEVDLGAEAVTAVPLIVSELVSNAVQHAYTGGAPGRIHVAVFLDGAGGLCTVVSDDGRWRPRDRAGPGADGFGLGVVRELATDVLVESGLEGTRVTVVYPAGRPTGAVLGERWRLRQVPDAPLSCVRQGSTPPVLAVGGPVDIDTVGELRSAVLHHSAGGLREIVIDLSTVTLLASAGARMLHEMARLPTPPVVVAPENSPSHRMLQVACLGHRPDLPR